MGDAALHSELLLAEVQQQDKPQPTRVYARRWYIVGTYAVFSCLQGWLWGLAGSVGTTYQQVYGVDGTTVQLMLNWGPIFYLAAMLPFALWLDSPGGLRWSTVCSMALVTAGAALRCILFDASTASVVLLHISYILNDIAGPISMGATSLIAERWFPAGERGLATGLASMANYAGNVLSFWVGPAMVSTGDPVKGMRAYMYLGLALCVANLGAMLAYFPSAPPSPPSISAAHGRERGRRFNLTAFRAALWACVTNRDFVVLCGAYGLSGGMSSGWASTLSLNLGTIGVDESQAGLIGVVGTLLGCAGGVVVGGLVDRVRRHKALLVASNSVAALTAAWFALVVQRAMPGASGAPGLAQIFVSAALTQLLLSGSVPLFFELAMEVTYPLPEGTVLMIMTGVFNFGGLLILFVPIQSSTALFNWLFAGTTAVLTLALAVFARDGRKRQVVDEGGGEEEGAHKLGGAGAELEAGGT